MKKHFVIGAFFLCFLTSIAQDEVKVKSTIKDVTVFLQGAQVEREGVKIIEDGITKLKFDYLSPNIDASSIKVNGTGALTILSVTHSLNYLREGRTHSKVQFLEDSLKLIDNKLAINQGILVVLKEERNMVIANNQVNNNSGFDIEDLDDLALFYREKLTEIVKEEVQLQTEKERLVERQQKIRKQIKELNKKWDRSTGEIVVEVSSKVRTTARISLSYLVNNAGWVPTYDIRIKDTNSPLTLNYKAKVYQNSGVDWNDVNLTLATNNPKRNNNKPTLRPWFLRYSSPGRALSRKYSSMGGAVPKSRAELAPTYFSDGMEVEEFAMEDAEMLDAHINVSNNQLNTAFNVKLPYSVPSDGKKYEVNIQSDQLESEYKYFAAPKQSKDAYLLARLTDWGKLNLLPGQASVFFEGMYTGKSYINPANTNDTLDLSLGVDPDIVITRKKINEFCSTQTLGANKSEQIGIEITVRNTKPIPVEIDLTDQVPLSTDKDMMVEIIEKSEAVLEEQTGYLDWNLRLEPGQTKSFIVKYIVKYPKEKNIGHLE